MHISNNFESDRKESSAGSRFDERIAIFNIQCAGKLRDRDAILYRFLQRMADVLFEVAEKKRRDV